MTKSPNLTCKTCQCFLLLLVWQSSSGQHLSPVRAFLEKNSKSRSGVCGVGRKPTNTTFKWTRLPEDVKIYEKQGGVRTSVPFKNVAFADAIHFHIATTTIVLAWKFPESATIKPISDLSMEHFSPEDISGGHEVHPVRLPLKAFLIVNVGLQCPDQHSLRRSKEDNGSSRIGSANSTAGGLRVTKRISSGCRDSWRCPGQYRTDEDDATLTL